MEIMKIKIISACAMAALTLLTALTLLLVPGNGALLQEQLMQEHLEREEDPQQQMAAGRSDMELLEGLQSQGGQMEHQMWLELPEGVGMEQIKVESHVLSQTVSVSIPRVDQEYYSEHPLRGSSSHIHDLVLGSEGGVGIIEISLDEVYEVEARVEGSRLYLDFVPPGQRYEKVIVVDAGHGGSKPGAVEQGICEKDLNLGIVLELKAILDQHPEWKVYYTRVDDADVSLIERVQLANLSRADMFISIHNNATRASGVNGTEVLYDDERVGEELGTERLSAIFLEETVASCGSRSLGLTKGHSIYIIRNSQVPVALIELGFMTNRAELGQLSTEEYQKKAAQGIYQGIVRAIEEGF